MENSIQTFQSPLHQWLAKLASWRKVSLISTFAVVGLVLIIRPRSTPFWLFTVSDVVELLMMLFLVALFIERAVEVIMGTWRGKEKQELQAAVSRHLRLAPDSKEGLAALDKAYEDYRAEFRVFSLLVALFLGLVISAVGVRVLQPLVDPAAFRALSESQRAVFSATDTFVTGAMLGGGSEGLHRILDTFLAQFDRWRTYTKDRTNQRLENKG